MQVRQSPIPVIRRVIFEGINMIRHRKTLFAGTALASLALIAAACGSSGGSSSASKSPSASTTKPASSQSAPPATVAIAKTNLGNVLVDAQGRTLYMFGADMGTTSACSGACAQNWPPLLASGQTTGGSGAKTSLVGTTTRSDGTQQVTYDGHPVYRFAGDHKAGDTNGQGLNAFGGIWSALTSAGGQVAASAPSGGGYGY
jgi:predicted lipoprotein with Yx(FWY)xxD motif